MPTFKIEQFELHADEFAAPACGASSGEVAEDCYQTQLDLTDAEIRKLDKNGHALNEDGGIPSIRSVEKI